MERERMVEAAKDRRAADAQVSERACRKAAAGGESGCVPATRSRVLARPQTERLPEETSILVVLGAPASSRVCSPPWPSRVPTPPVPH